jgi:hypothetical protein
LRAQHPPRGKYQENRAARKSDIYYIDEKCPADLRVSFSRRASLFKSEKAEHSQNNCGGNEENAGRMTFFHVACIANFSTTKSLKGRGCWLLCRFWRCFRPLAVIQNNFGCQNTRPK